MAVAAANPVLKTLSMSITSSLNIPSIFNPKSLHFSISSKPNKLSLSLSSSPLLSLQKQTTIVPKVAQTSEWDQQQGVVEQQGGSDQEYGQGNAQEPPEEAKVFVGNLPWDVDSEKLAQLFEDAGVVEISQVIYNRETERSRGFGFVTMSTVEEAEKAVEMFNNYEIDGRSLTVNKAAPRGSRPERIERQPREFQPSFRVYVGNLSWDMDDVSLEQLFSEHGKVLSARVVSDRETGRSRGFGFVTMASEAEMNDVISALDGQTVDGRAIRVNVAEERKRF